MMTIEKELAKTDLNQFKTEPLKLLVKQLYKHQNFKNKVVLERINCLTYTQNTVELYLTAMRRYLKTGAKSKTVAKRIYDIVDELKATHESILTPSEKDRVTTYNYKQTTTVPQQFTTEPIPTKTINLGQYGVKINNTIKLFPTKDACMAYIECYREFDTTKDLAIVNLVIRYN